MVESVDTRDLKSLGHCGRVGSSPTSGTTKRAGSHVTASPLFFVPEVGIMPLGLLHYFDDRLAQILNDVAGNHAIGAVLLCGKVAGQAMQIHTQYDRPVGGIVLGDE